MDSSIAKKTQETLGKVIKKPPLTEKLLSKPPFRFLHDIITEVIKNTGVLKGLYTADEMNSANVKEKEAKIAFLQKVIDVVVIVSGVSLSVRPSKIVAGHEPEKTNELLQELAKIVLSKKSTSEAVKTVLSGGKPSKGSADAKRKESRSGSKDREISKEKEREKSAERGSGKKESRKKDGNGDERKQRESSASKDDSGKKEKKDRERKEKRDRSQEREKEREPEKSSRQDEEGTPDGVDTGLIDGNLEENESQQNRIPRPSSAKGQRRRHADGEVEDSQGGETEGITSTDAAPTTTEQMNGVLHEDELPQQVIQSRRIARPSSARPAPPKIKKQQEEMEDQITRIGSGKQNTNVIVDDGKDDDDDETFVVEDNHAITNDIDTVPSSESLEDDSGHGGLVRKILETKKELEGSKDETVKAVKEKSIISDAARRKERELAQKEIEKLRGSIQTLTRSANPLGKIMDYIQEDVDSMNKELEMWRTENKEHTIALKREQSITDSEIEPLKAQLEGLESDITEMVDRISTVKCNILKNEEKIQKMLSSISFNSR